jgi:hypothetical protein
MRGGANMGKKVPESLRKALYEYTAKPEEEAVENLLKSCFSDNKVYNNNKRSIIPKKGR